jgi:chemotaxis protein CheX
MDKKWLDSFIAATARLFSTMLSIEATAGTPRIKIEPFPTFDVSGLIGFSGLAQGSVAISFPRETALKVVSAMVGVTYADVDRDVCDAVGEIANIIAGGAKKDLAELKLSISLPQVVVGKGHILSSISTIPVTVVPFSTSIGDFVLELCLRKNREVV